MTGDRKPASELAALRGPGLPGESGEYAAARQDLLAREIEARRVLGDLAERRRALPPGPPVTKDYRFVDENGDDVGLADLFGAHDTLMIYFWMFGPERERPCPMCTNFLGGANGNAADLAQRLSFRVLGRSPIERQKAFAIERGWDDLSLVQTAGDDFARDHNALDDEGNEGPALIVFTREGDTVRYFYASEMPAGAADPGEDPRGPVDIAPLWNLLDMTPEGRGTDWRPRLSYP